ncbi:hypothetical protein MSAN_01137900 [Mycena sanguinolenta]|uniref:Uncharacterized protein n=1 Tax=Mycena sanguinolenta TaxID=230812 RepID=A0A8H6YNF4_9AGAR|nr:hypothetical protein MSAN_01137900 [Mycena sanguinolenta]
MSSLDSKGRYPQDIVAIFHASFHPTQGNIIDWSLKANDGEGGAEFEDKESESAKPDLSLDNLEFSALPSGLHLVEEDVVYFNKDGQQGVCVFRRRKTIDHGHRGFRLSSLGILLAKSARPRPWRHTAALKELTTLIYSRFESSALLVPLDSDWEPARAFFEERKVTRSDLGGAGDWNGWSHELLERLDDDSTAGAESDASPTAPLTDPRPLFVDPLQTLEAASILCQVAADMAYEQQVEYTSSPRSSRLTGKSKGGISVLGMVTLNDMDRMKVEGNGWVACTTDAIFLEKPSCYDLLIDLTTSTPNKATRPTFHASRPQPAGSRPTHRLSVVRFSWSDIKLVRDHVSIVIVSHQRSGTKSVASCNSMRLRTTTRAARSARSRKTPSRRNPTPSRRGRTHGACTRTCASSVRGSGWARGGATRPSRTRPPTGRRTGGSVRLEGDEDLSLHALNSTVNTEGHVRSVGMGIEGGPQVASGSGLTRPSTRTTRRASAMSWSSGKATVTNASTSARGKGPQLAPPEDEGAYETARRDGQILTTLSLLQTLHAHTAFQLSTLERFLPKDGADVVTFASKDMAAFELGPMSGMDARYLEWLALEYGRCETVVIKRGWKDMLAAVFGYG